MKQPQLIERPETKVRVAELDPSDRHSRYDGNQCQSVDEPTGARTCIRHSRLRYLDTSHVVFHGPANKYWQTVVSVQSLSNASDLAPVVMVASLSGSLAERLEHVYNRPLTACWRGADVRRSCSLVVVTIDQDCREMPCQ